MRRCYQCCGWHAVSRELMGGPHEVPHGVLGHGRRSREGHLHHAMGDDHGMGVEEWGHGSSLDEVGAVKASLERGKEESR